jgi:hypothetical protein
MGRILRTDASLNRRFTMKSVLSHMILCMSLCFVAQSSYVVAWTGPKAPNRNYAATRHHTAPASKNNYNEDINKRASTAATETSLDGIRRKILIWTVPSILATTGITTATPAAAAAANDIGHAIRKSASILPGYGPSDVYYPIQFQGLWNMKREIIRDGDKPNLIFNYKVRFLSSDDGDTTSNQAAAAAVADRGYNQAHLEAAIRGAKGDEASKQDDISGAVRSYDWNVNNPNELQVAMVDGSSKYIKVTKRATEATDTTVFSSEFQRVSQQNTLTGIPVITARRVQTKWKVTAVDKNNSSNDNKDNADSSIEGLEIVYDMGGGGDPLSATTTTALASQAEPKVISKSRLTLERER